MIKIAMKGADECYLRHFLGYVFISPSMDLDGSIWLDGCS